MEDQHASEIKERRQCLIDSLYEMLNETNDPYRKMELMNHIIIMQGLIRNELNDENDIIKKEGDYKYFLYRGYKCHICRNPNMLSLNGYVELPKGHKLYGTDGENLAVHGGITWSGKNFPDGSENGNWILGFDCSHAGDLTIISLSSQDIYRTMEYVQNELKSLVDQVDIYNI